MELQEQQDDKTAQIFGMRRSRKELLINGIVFILINVGYSIFNLITQLPEGIKDNPELLDEFSYQPSSLIVTVFLSLIGYILINIGIFGSDIKNLIEKYGVLGYFLRKIALILALIFVTLVLEIIILFFIL